jgi:hypothetical protein
MQPQPQQQQQQQQQQEKLYQTHQQVDKCIRKRVNATAVCWMVQCIECTAGTVIWSASLLCIEHIIVRQLQLQLIPVFVGCCCVSARAAAAAAAAARLDVEIMEAVQIYLLLLLLSPLLLIRSLATTVKSAAAGVLLAPQGRGRMAS